MFDVLSGLTVAVNPLGWLGLRGVNVDHLSIAVRA